MGPLGILAETIKLKESVEKRFPVYSIDETQLRRLKDVQNAVDFINRALNHGGDLNHHLEGLPRLLYPSETMIAALLRGHREEAYARGLGILFQRLLCLQLAYTSYLMCMANIVHGRPPWAQMIMAKECTLLSAAFMTGFLGSWVCNFSVPHIEGYLDSSQVKDGPN